MTLNPSAAGRETIARSSRAFTERLANKWRRFTIDNYGRRDFRLQSDVPLVSFTFDDFPRTALIEGGRILAKHGVRGTYFVSLRLLGLPSVSGTIADWNDLKNLVQSGHELGCHTFDHLDGSDSTVDAFERSIEANRASLRTGIAGVDLPVFAYPLNGPTFRIKKVVGRRFAGCRGGGQTFNTGAIDLNLLKAYFLDWRNRGDLAAVRRVIDENAAARGWLIFATHDVASEPSRYGCEPEYFEEVVRFSLQSGARVLPMMQVCRELRIAG
jgi:peptidoglycan/xylan/chitin deacetylase (PgdA/CDA1 family)